MALLRRIVLATTKPGDTIFDQFNGGGTTGIAVASIGKRKYIGCDLYKDYIDLTKRRYEILGYEKAIRREEIREIRKKTGVKNVQISK